MNGDRLCYALADQMHRRLSQANDDLINALRKDRDAQADSVRALVAVLRGGRESGAIDWDKANKAVGDAEAVLPERDSVVSGAHPQGE